MRSRQHKRFDYLVHMIKKNNFRVGAEIGCLNGVTSQKLLSNCPDLILYCVDVWEYIAGLFGEREERKRMNGDFEGWKDEFDRRVKPYADRVRMLQGVSWEMAKGVEDESLDFIFIDADHSYGSVKKDILAWMPKVREGGMVTGHDYNLPGVRQALDELIPSAKDTGVQNVWIARKEEVMV